MAWHGDPQQAGMVQGKSRKCSTQHHHHHYLTPPAPPLHAQKVTLDPLSAMLNAPARDKEEDNEDNNAAAVPPPPLPASVPAAHDATLGALDLNVESLSPSPPPPLP